MSTFDEAAIAAELATKFQYLNVLGRGTFGTVVLCRDTRLAHAPLVAIKLLPRGAYLGVYRVYVAREILHHGSLVHPFIIGCYEVFLTPNFLCVMMEYAPHGDLFRYITSHPQRHLNENEARQFFQQLIIGLDYIHGRGVANRDLKLENLLLSSIPSSRPDSSPRAVVKICDFGYSKHEFNSSAHSRVGTPIYMSPEIILGGTAYNIFKADIWSAGVVLYVLLSGRYPFDRESKDYTMRVVQGQWVPFDPRLGLSSEVQSLVGAMLRPNPEARPTLGDIMSHPWFVAGLPDDALQLNQHYFSIAPDPSKPPLSVAMSMVNDIVTKAASPGNPEDSFSLSCRFPAYSALEQTHS